MTNSIEERDSRRSVIIEGIEQGLSNEKIAEKLGVHQRVVRRDLSRMHHSKDLELKKAQIIGKERADKAKESKANRAGEKFKSITGMTFQEKTFNNMMTFYEPEIRKIMRSKNQDVAIRNLPSSVVRTLKRNGIIAPGWKTPEVTQKARVHLAGSQLI